MDTLFALSAFASPNRMTSWSLRNPFTGITRPVTLEDHYQLIDPNRLSDNVPEDIRIHFDTARKLVLH
jgi:hypothetical protein